MPQLSIGDFVREPANYFVSLGSKCATAHNIRRHFNFSAPFPFDWRQKPESALILLLQNPDVDALYNQDALELTKDAGSVRHRALDVRLHHEFPRWYGQKGEPVKENFFDFVAKPKKITRFLFRKLFELNDPACRIAFIREDFCTSGVEAALSSKFTDAERCLIPIGHMPDDGYGWTGNSAEWEQKLMQTHLVLDTSNHSPFVETMAEHRSDSRLHIRRPITYFLPAA